MKKGKAGTGSKKIDLTEIREIADRARRGPITEQEHAKLLGAVDSFANLVTELGARGATIARLRQVAFGPKTETARRVLGQAEPRKDSQEGAPAEEKKRPPGHGRNGARAYTGAKLIEVAHGTLEHGQRCPECTLGKIYRQKDPKKILRVNAVAPIEATRYEMERLRCNACGQVFTAASPPGVGEKVYDQSVAALIGLLKYGTGLPFFRLQKLERSLGILLASSTQWDLVKEAAEVLVTAYGEAIHQAAQGRVIHNDDTAAKILKLAEIEPERGERKGVFTTGIVSTSENRKIALFFTGRRHAGENLAALLKERDSDLGPPTQMCDGESRNTCGNDVGSIVTILSNCLTHARRQFVEVESSFPKEVEHLILELGKVYKVDEEAKVRGLSDEERLALHQDKSQGIMDGLHEWLKRQAEEHLIEPNSSLGQAIAYTLTRWDKLTVFLRVPGAPLDNNLCERALKRPILHRKNSLFFKTQAGARVADIYMSLIHTAELCQANPFDYLLALLRHPDQVAAAPADWMPWNYRQTLEGIGSGPGPPG